ncbi:hypothetical protein RS130_21240 [Paraglaciecola aquimarina]|uniref:Uncharacterized protein n=1 Tax=Paraglaciecola aquimarina TaxID=1235557 RepID=A0ABU3T1C6_9ALTE|nr:hypothetical protein [Paraglaciecola aquimarina]MDU0356079.1 hypothetical protein [Paraglaciecola aquimarina]
MTVILLLLIVTLTTLYTGRNQSFEHQIMLNNQNYRMAQIAADNGLQKQIAALLVTKGNGLQAVTSLQSEKNSYEANAASKLMNTSYGERLFITLDSVGKSADELATVTLTEHILVYPVLQNIPVAPLMVKGGMGSLGSLEIVTNVNGLGVGGALSIWSDKAVLLPKVGSMTCKPVDYHNAECDVKFISNDQYKGADILDNAGSFPDNLFGYLFNTPVSGIEQFKAQANFQYEDCELLNSHSVGLIWVQGDCVIDTAGQVGTSAVPVVLVVEDGNVVFADNVRFYGLLLSYQTMNATQEHFIDMNIGSAINGALLSNHKLGQLDSMLRIVYDQTILTRLTGQTTLQRLAKVPKVVGEIFECTLIRVKGLP